MTAVNGFRARRMSHGLTIQQVAAYSGVSPYIIHRCEEGDFEQVSMYRLIALADTLGISLSEGCRVRQVPGSRQRPRRQEPRNILENYMVHWELTLQGMAVILDVSVQTVSVQCGKADPAMKYIRRLAEEEGMSVHAFVEFYSTTQCA